MEIELWSKDEEVYGFVIKSDTVKHRVYLENHMLLEGIDVSEIDGLNTLYTAELLNKKEKFDSRDFLINLSRDWFTVTSYFNTYVELFDCIVFNYNNCKFESLVDTYSDCAERYIDAYDVDGNPDVLGEFEFDIRRTLDLEKEFTIKVDTYYEEHLYRIKGNENYLFIKSDLNTNVSTGIVIGREVANSLMRNGNHRII